MENALVATYRLEAAGDIGAIAKRLVELETTGGYGEGEVASDLLRRCTGQVLGIEHETPQRAVVRLAFPLENFDLERNAFASLWLTLVGGATHALLDYEASRLLDFEIPDAAKAAFPGPGFSTAGIRELLGVGPDDRYRGRPARDAGRDARRTDSLLLGTIVKPTAGLTPDEVARICYEGAVGGLRFIKDDEKMMNCAYCPLAERVDRVMEALRRARDKTGQVCLYAPHITAGPEKLLEDARIAIEHGANAIMVNVFAAGFHALERLARHPEINVPLYAHCGGKEALGRAPNQGVAPEVVAKFIRLMGGDLARVGARGGYLVGNSDEELRSLHAAYTQPWGQVPPTMPAISGGLKPANLATNLDMFGTDVFYLAGTGVTKHPGGIPGGVRAMQLAAEAWEKGIPAEEYAREHQVLARGLTY
jgi:ribulose 1,5-bisphosphate carboxylase large subunit-like protein